MKAVELYRALADTRPDAFRPDLAMTLNNLSNRLADRGRALIQKHLDRPTREVCLASVEVCRPFTRLAVHRLFNRQIGPTNPGDRHAMSRSGPESPSTTECATVYR